jgi:hypothetical protein
MTYTLQSPTNLKHWVTMVALGTNPRANVEAIMQALDSQGEDWVLASTEVHEGILYIFLVLQRRIQVVEIYKPPMKDEGEGD